MWAEEQKNKPPLSIWYFSLSGYGPFLSADFRARVAAVGGNYAAQVALPQDPTANGCTKENVQKAILHVWECGGGAFAFKPDGIAFSETLSAFAKEVLPYFSSGRVASSPFGWAKSGPQLELLWRILKKFADTPEKIGEFLKEDRRCHGVFEQMYLRGCYLRRTTSRGLVEFCERLLGHLARQHSPAGQEWLFQDLVDGLCADGFAAMKMGKVTALPKIA
ncbi:MAG: hypothetical protein LBF24_00275 [Puniceicoccales bacterium]|nr:hypothetical protein [Puniceicoccales bacterium]